MELGGSFFRDGRVRRGREVVREARATMRGDLVMTEEEIREIIRDEVGHLFGVALRPKPDKMELYRKIAARYQDGLAMGKVAAEFGVSVSTVQTALKGLGVPARPKGPNHSMVRDMERDRLVREMWEQGKRASEIGHHFKITRERARQLLIRMGIDPGKPNLTPEQKAAVARYVAGESLIYVAESIGVNHITLRKWVEKAGEKVRTKPRYHGRRRLEITNENAKRAAELYKEGKLAREIAEELGIVAPEAIYRLLAYAGVKPDRQRKK